MRTARALIAAVFIAGGLWAAAEEPKPTSLTEKVETRLVQLDVAVQGDPDAIRALTAKDFALFVGGHEIQGVILDRLCGDEPQPVIAQPTDQPTATPAERVVPKVIRARATFIFFFDQTHLTTMGRALSLETAKDLINRLVVEGSRAAIVSNARRVETIVPMTGDREKLIAGLERLRNDPKQWDSYAETERSRLQEALRSFSRASACSVARTLAREEWMMARQSMERLGFALGTLADVPAPKGLVFFGDTLRQRAGSHFVYIGCGSQSREYSSASIIPSAAAEFDELTKAAVAHGVHFYSVQAEGLLAYDERQTPFDDPRGTSWDTMRHRHAQDALVGLAAETGGEAFLGGASNKFIADRIETLTSCRLLLSFPPGDLPRDKAMNVTLTLNVPKVKIQTQGRIVVPSQAAIENARLLAAFVDPASSDDGSLRALVIPRGGDGKKWKGSVQLRLRPTGLPDNSAELGASIVRRDTVTDHFASSIATKSGSRAMVLEKSLDFAPGDFSVVAVARDATRGDIGSSRFDGTWPNPQKNAAAIAPIAVLQTGVAAISKDGMVSSSGLLARDVDETLDPSASISLASVVCRGSKTKAPVVVERWLEGGANDEFVPMTIDGADGPCVQTIDVVAAGRLQPGLADYRIVARVGDEIVAQERRTLRVGGAR